METQEENMEYTQMTPVFHVLFLPCLFVTFLNLKILKIHFQIHYFGPFWPVKYLNFSRKAIDWDSLSYFSRK